MKKILVDDTDDCKGINDEEVIKDKHELIIMI